MKFLLGLLLLMSACSSVNRENQMISNIIDVGVRIEGTQGHGSGVVVYSEKDFSLVLTNKHVCEIVNDVAKVNRNGKTPIYDGIVLKLSSKYDLCVMRINVGDIPVALLGSENVMGEQVFVNSNPLFLKNSTTSGFAGDIDRFEGTEFEGKYIQHSAIIYPGSSGSGLFNIEGKLIGINTLAVPQVVTAGYAITIDIITEFLNESGVRYSKHKTENAKTRR